jgi:molecular chaperone DnaK
MLRVAVDFGTSSTCAALSVDGREPQVVVVDGAPLMPSAVYVTGDGTLFVGHEADRQAAVDPSRYEPHPKRRIDEPELLLGDTVLPVVGVVRAVLRRALLEARHLAGGANVDQLVLTHPADWGAARTQKLRRAAHALAGELVLVPEPVAAAVFHAQHHAMPQDGYLAVLDLGGGTVDASVVRRVGAAGFRVLGTRGDPHFGGADVDQALLDHVGAQVRGEDAEAWRRLVEGRELADRRRRRVLRQDVRGAKETLSRHTFADVPMPTPFPDAHVTRADLEALIAEPMHRTVALLVDTLSDAGVRPEQLAGVFLVGGSSRIPMVSRLVHERLGILPITLDQPETVVARGALITVMVDPDRTAAVPPSVFTPHPRPATPVAAAPRPVATPPSHPGGPAAHPGVPARLAAPPQRPAPMPHPGTPAGPPASAQPPFLAQPPHRPKPTGRRRWWLVGVGAVVVVLAATALVVALTQGGGGQQPAQPTIEAYHYRFALPDGWRRDGGREDKRQVEIAPTDTSSVPDRIYVNETPLSYDASSDRDRAVFELRTHYESTRAATNPPSVDGFDPAARFADREVVHYTEKIRAGTVDWYVLLGGRFEVSIGCLHDAAGQQRVAAACQDVVRTLDVQPS